MHLKNVWLTCFVGDKLIGPDGMPDSVTSKISSCSDSTPMAVNCSRSAGRTCAVCFEPWLLALSKASWKSSRSSSSDKSFMDDACDIRSFKACIRSEAEYFGLKSCLVSPCAPVAFCVQRTKSWFLQFKKFSFKFRTEAFATCVRCTFSHSKDGVIYYYTARMVSYTIAYVHGFRCY